MRFMNSENSGTVNAVSPCAGLKIIPFFSYEPNQHCHIRDEVSQKSHLERRDTHIRVEQPVRDSVRSRRAPSQARRPGAQRIYIILPSTGTINRATMLMILMSGLMAGPAVSL